MLGEGINSGSGDPAADLAQGRSTGIFDCIAADMFGNPCYYDAVGLSGYWDTESLGLLL